MPGGYRPRRVCGESGRLPAYVAYQEPEAWPATIVLRFHLI